MPDLRKILEQVADAYNRRDPDGFAAAFDPECDWHPVLTRAENDPGYHGHSGIRRWFEDVDEMFDYVDFEVYFDDLRQVDDRVLIRGRLHAKGRESGAEVTSDVGWLGELRGEKFLRVRGYASYEDARRAAEEASTLSREGARRATQLAATSTLSQKGAEELIREQERAETWET
jgi:ketosteroid isomerase-like protein